MSIIIKHQQERLAQLQGQLAYVNGVLNDHGDTLVPWEIKEYQDLQSDYTTQVCTLQDTINRSILNS